MIGRKIGLGILLLVTGCRKEPAHGIIGITSANDRPYLAIVGQPEMARFSNVISAVWHTNDCCLIRWVEGNRTNEFHAWNVPVIVYYTNR